MLRRRETKAVTGVINAVALTYQLTNAPALFVIVDIAQEIKQPSGVRIGAEVHITGHSLRILPDRDTRGVACIERRKHRMKRVKEHDHVVIVRKDRRFKVDRRRRQR